jgi:hypothetical protein
VCAGEAAAQEMRLMLQTLRLYHQQPVLVVCDEAAAAVLQKLSLPAITYAPDIQESRIRVLMQSMRPNPVFDNRFTSIMLFKMDAMTRAIRAWGDTMYLDGDQIVVGELQKPFNAEIGLSPHYHTPWRELHRDMMIFGVYNAGMVWCKDERLVAWWQNTVLKDAASERWGRSSNWTQPAEEDWSNPHGVFFDQTALDGIHEATGRVGYFDYGYNVGFWRMQDRPRDSIEDIEKAYAFEVGYGVYMAGYKVRTFHVHAVSKQNLYQKFFLPAIVSMLGRSTYPHHAEIAQMLASL